MGCDTKIKLRGRISKEELLQFIETICEDVSCELKTDECYNIRDRLIIFDNKDHFSTTTGFISLTYKNEERNLFYYYSNALFIDDIIDEHEEYNMVETTTLSLAYTGCAVELGTKIVSHFGGWIQFNDCSDDEYIKIN